MNKKLLTIIGIILAITFISWGIYDLNTKGRDYTRYVEKNYSNITGKIIQIGGEDKEIALGKLKPLGVQDINLAIAVYSETTEPQYYLLYDLSGIYKELLKLNPDEVVGKCIDLYALPELKENEKTNSYTDGLKLLFIDTYEISNNTNCLANSIQINPVYTEYDNKIILTAKIKSAVRPAYDIAYDYQIEVPYGEVKNFGYGDASGRGKIDSEIVTIPLITEDLTILKQLEQRKRSGADTKLQGVFQWGYAEIMVFNVLAITE